MKNLLGFALALLLAVPAVAQSSDFAMFLDAELDGSRPDHRLPIGEHAYYLVQWTIAGSFDAADVAIEVDLPGVVAPVDAGGPLSCTSGKPIRCTFTEAPRNGFLQLISRIDTPGVHTATARVIHKNAPDANPSNDTATHAVEAIALPELTVSPSIFLTRMDPGQRGTFSVSSYNLASTPATNVVLTVTLPEGGTVLGGGPQNSAHTCTVAGNALVCTAPSLAREETFAVDVAIEAPARTAGGSFAIRIAVTSAEEDLDPSDNQVTRNVALWRQFAVTNVDDEGSGSLRQAIHDVNALCPVPQPCAILFRVPAPVPASGWFTIRPRTPLPEIVASIKIDGATQTLFTGDSNPQGPEIEIDGALVLEQSGLRLGPNCDADVRNLAVNNFPGYGIVVQRQPAIAGDPCRDGSVPYFSEVRDNYLGTDPRGQTAKPNQRGLGLFDAGATVTGNLIGGNRRAGIYVGKGGYTNIRSNRIGVATDGSPLGNGAGILFDLGELPFGVPGADVVENVIAYNDGMAIARTRRGEIQITKNAIFDNLQQGIDVDLDGPTAHSADDRDVPNAPVLFAAAYDPARDVTIVRGRVDTEAPGNSVFVELYASARLSVWGTPQAERSVTDLVFVPTRHQDIEIVVPGDLRGKWITATVNMTRYLGFVRNPGGGISTQNHLLGIPTNTSELSNGVVVQ